MNDFSIQMFLQSRPVLSDSRICLTLQMFPSLDALINCSSMKNVDFLMNYFIKLVNLIVDLNVFFSKQIKGDFKLFDLSNQPFETSSQTNKTKQWILPFHLTPNEEKLFWTTVASKASLIWLFLFKRVFLNQNNNWITRIFLWNIRCFGFESEYVELSLNELIRFFVTLF